MYKYLPITDVYAREILDSRGNPTIEVEVLAGDEFCGRASVPSVHRPESMKHWNYGIKKDGTEGLVYNRQQIMLMQGLHRK